MPFFHLLNKKEGILKNVGNQTVADFHNIYIDFHNMEKILWKATVWLPKFFQILSFVFNRRKKLIKVWNYLRVSIFDRIFSLSSTWMMQRLPQDNGASALTTHQLQVERRENDWANSVDGDY